MCEDGLSVTCSNLPFYLVSAFAESAFPVSGRKLVDLRFHYVVQQTPKQKKNRLNFLIF